MDKQSIIFTTGFLIALGFFIGLHNSDNQTIEYLLLLIVCILFLSKCVQNKV